MAAASNRVGGGESFLIGTAANLRPLRKRGIGDGLAVDLIADVPPSDGQLDKWAAAARREAGIVAGWVGADSLSDRPVRSFDRISRVGVELEGGWDSDPSGRTGAHRLAEGGGRLVDDGSVSTPGNFRGGAELRSRPLTSLDDVMAFVQNCYPENVDGSAGLHVHVSVRSTRDYALLMRPAFLGGLYRRLDGWGRAMGLAPNHRFWGRLDGGNTFCRATFDPEAQLTEEGHGSSRYSALNFCAYHSHQTLEFRALPMFRQPDTAAKAVRAYVEYVERYLRSCAKTGGGSRERKVRVF
jgi:hypothetical protein